MRTNVTRAVEQVSINIRKVREFRNYSQFFMGSELGLTQNGYSKIELNQSKLTIDRLHQIAEVLAVQVTDLIELDLDTIDRLQAKKIAPSAALGIRKPYIVNYFRIPSGSQ